MNTLRNKMIQQMQLKGYSRRTIESYTKSIVSLANYYKTGPDLLSQGQIRDYIQYHIVEKKISKVWCNQLISALKILFCEVLKREWSHADIPRPRREKKLPVVLSKEEIGKLFSCTANLKHRAIITLTYSAGLRLSEVKNLKLVDIDSKRMTIRVVQAKGFKDRYAVLSPVTLNILRDYWKTYRPVLWLFETKLARSLPEKPFSTLLKTRFVNRALKNKWVFIACGTALQRT